MKIALDTNTIVYFFKGMGEVSQHLSGVAPSDVLVPAVVAYELHVGVERSANVAKRRGQLQRFLGAVQVVPLGPREAEVSARVRAELEAQGLPIGPLDVLIAGTALAHGATLVTHNLREFSRVQGLQVVDWYETSPNPVKT